MWVDLPVSLKDTQLKKIEIDNVIFDGFEIEAKNVTDICGGFD